MNDASTTDTTTTTAGTVTIPDDPTDLAAREGVEEATQSFVHDGEDYCEASSAGRAIVGVTNDRDEVLLVVAENRQTAVLPSPKVERNGDWVSAARGELKEVADIDVRITGVERVRHAEQILDGGGDPVDVTTHLVLAAEPVAADPDPAAPAGESWTVEWHENFPEDLLDAERPSGDDVALFLN